MKPLGVGINALPYAIRELAGLDLLSALDAIGVRTRRLTLMDHPGQTIWLGARGLFGGHDMPQFSGATPASALAGLAALVGTVMGSRRWCSW